jgi:orotate phosphoribosyltransferase-like protein
MRETQPQIAARLMNNGLNTREVAAAMGITYKHASNVMTRARQAGLVPPLDVSTAERARNQLRKRGIACGSIADTLNALTPEVAGWLAAQAVEGASLADLIAGFITDAYFEENDA